MERSQQLVDAFLEDISQFLEDMEESVADLEKDREKAVGSLFRIFHSIKASAGLLHYEHFARFAHLLEDLLSQMRGGKKEITNSDVDFFFETEDLLKGFQERLAAGYEEKDFIKDSHWMGKLEKALIFLEGKVRREKPEKTEEVFSNGCRLEIQFDPDIFSSGSDPLIYLGELQEKFTIQKIKAKIEVLPSLEELDPFRYYLVWEAEIVGPCRQDEIQKIFKFLDDQKTG